MMYATRIKMKNGSQYSQNLLEIDEIYIKGCTQPGYYKKAAVHDCVQESPGSIKVDIWPYPSVIPEISAKGEKYVRSTPDAYRHDDLLRLPRD